MSSEPKPNKNGNALAVPSGPEGAPGPHSSLVSSASAVSATQFQKNKARPSADESSNNSGNSDGSDSDGSDSVSDGSLASPGRSSGVVSGNLEDQPGSGAVVNEQAGPVPISLTADTVKRKPKLSKAKKPKPSKGPKGNVTSTVVAENIENPNHYGDTDGVNPGPPGENLDAKWPPEGGENGKWPPEGAENGPYYGDNHANLKG